MSAVSLGTYNLHIPLMSRRVDELIYRKIWIKKVIYYLLVLGDWLESKDHSN